MKKESCIAGMSGCADRNFRDTAENPAPAADPDGIPTEYSNYGPKCVDLFAPGERIYSTIPRSMGVPEVNGSTGIGVELHKVSAGGTAWISEK